mmetsp:Transcript_1615/g.6095  ORF Transcript_1615/g.6095 Transcript_1615/m.6095 type:complete len:209 (-) Transcript_1615:2125-2751(-)
MFDTDDAVKATSSGPTASTRTRDVASFANASSLDSSSPKPPNVVGLPNLSLANTATVASLPAIATSIPPGRSFAPVSVTTHFALSGAAGARVTVSGAPGNTSRAKPPHHRRCDSAANTLRTYVPASSALNRAICQGAVGWFVSTPTSASTAPGPSPSATTTNVPAASASRDAINFPRPESVAASAALSRRFTVCPRVAEVLVVSFNWW